MHQIIETIEFVLGAISNTASYLRLWALSLAHGQLSKVFFKKTIGGGIEGANAITIAIGMYLFFNITLGVIMGMDTMECFLHALRLQWVEFQSKFFKADGWKFVPLTLVEPIQAKIDARRKEEWSDLLWFCFVYIILDSIKFDKDFIDSASVWLWRIA